MILILASAMALMSEPVVCGVTLVAESRSSRAVISCPTGAEDVEAIGRAVLDSIDLPEEAGRFSRELTWTFSPSEEESTWNWPALQLYAPPPALPGRALSRGVSANCYVVGIPDSRGRLLQRQAECTVSDGGRSMARSYERALVDHSAYRVASASQMRCAAVSMSFRIGATDAEGWPDADALCAQIAGQAE